MHTHTYQDIYIPTSVTPMYVLEALTITTTRYYCDYYYYYYY